MMAQPSYAPVISSRFIQPYKFSVIVNRYCNGYLVITDIQNKIMFTVRSCDTNIHGQRVLWDECDRPVAMFREKKRTAHDRWNAFRDQSTADSDMIFCVAKNQIIQNHTHVNVSLANENGHNSECDFQIKGSWSNKNCTIYKGEFSTKVIAQMNLWQSPEKFMVTMNPNVDYEFVVALIAIVDAMKSPGSTKVVAGHVAGHVAAQITADVASEFIGAVSFS